MEDRESLEFHMNLLTAKLSDLNIKITSEEDLVSALNVRKMAPKKSLIDSLKIKDDGSLELSEIHRNLLQEIKNNKDFNNLHLMRFEELLGMVAHRILRMSEATKSPESGLELRYLESINEAKTKKCRELIERALCSSCYKRTRNAVLIPCGHVFCLHCVNSEMRDKTCQACNAEYSGFQKINFND